MADKNRNFAIFVTACVCGAILAFFAPDEVYDTFVLGFLGYLYFKTPY